MRSRITRRLALAVALVATLLLATGCNNPASPDAASVNGDTISRDELFADATAFAAIEGDPYQLIATSAADADDPTATTVVLDHAFRGEGLAGLLRDLIIGRIVDQSAERFGLTLEDEDRATAESQLGVYDALPAEQRDFVVRQIAMQAKVIDYVGANQWWTDEDIERYATELGDIACVKHILVTTEDEANDVLAQLDDGADFGELAQSTSIDTASGEEGGDLGCQPEGTFLPEFEAAYTDAAEGDLVGPVQTTAGYHVILVDSPFHAPTDDEARSIVEARFASGASGWVDYALRTADVQVDRRFGAWDPIAGTVNPPEGAQPAPGGALSFEL